MNVKNLSTGIDYSFGGITESIDFTYDQSKDNAPYKAIFTDSSESRITYDNLGRKFKDSLYKNGSIFLNSTYYYIDNASDSSKTSGLVSKINYNLSSIEDLEYSYDSCGNITQIKKGGNLLESYTYDKLNRLTRVDSLTQSKTIQYEYDKSGNITSKKEYPYNNTTSPTSTISYTYGDSNWKDKLTAYNGETIDYDAIGNPLSYKGKTFTWLGRRLVTYNNGSTATSYTYNSDGIRTSKTVGSTKTEYFLNGSQILAQKTGSNVIPFYYDANGTRIAFKYNGTMYYYVYNLQGDVTHILDASKNIVGTYQYDAWGKILNLSSLTAIAQANPFRYRGYYYDNESGLYYLNSRYYNAEWGRFINADGYITTGQGLTSYNMFVYCGNNPIMYADYTGEFYVAMKLTQVMVNLSTDIREIKNEVQQNKFIDYSKTVIQSVYTPIYDEYITSFAKWLQPASALSSSNTWAVKSFGAIADSGGIISAATAILQICWDYETYKDDIGTFVKSIAITATTTVLSVVSGAVIVWATPYIGIPMAFVATMASSVGIAVFDEYLRDKHLD
ncbi:MAG: RHS repeat-associated core domain-containing protein [Clostridia bacterium]|nr:RHS repeat-associated core domain-containing protein [Clostridia bacterium]